MKLNVFLVNYKTQPLNDSIKEKKELREAILIIAKNDFEKIRVKKKCCTLEKNVALWKKMLRSEKNFDFPKLKSQPSIWKFFRQQFHHFGFTFPHFFIYDHFSIFKIL